MKKGLSLISIIILLLSGILYAQSQTLTLDEAIQIALENNTDIKVSKMSTDKSSAAVREAFGYALPSLDLSADFSHFLKKPKMPFPDFEALLTNATYSILFDENVIPRDESKFVPIETTLQSFALNNAYTASLTLTQVLFNSAVFRGIGASQVYYDLSLAELRNTISKTKLNVERAFYGTLLTKELLSITQASYENAQENFRNVNALFEQGFVSDFDRLQAEVRVENIRPVLLQMENMLTTTLNDLKLVLGVDQFLEIDVEGEIVYNPEILPNEDDIIDYALTNNFGLQSMNLKMNLDEEFIQLDVSEYWPSLAAFGNFMYAGSSDEWNFQNYNATTVGLSLSMNLWQGNRTKNRVEQSTISYKQTAEQYALLQEYVVNQVKAKYLELKRVQSLVEAQQKNVSLAERAYELSTVRYKEGTGNQLEVQNQDVALRQARINKLQSVHSYIVTKYELEQLMGKINQEYIDPYMPKE
ncbi:MAG TPA: TolC family protein [Ignavibacteriaceae bacterium]|nr:TolC family protein [Ignavibacteriaceae bacterium]